MNNPACRSPTRERERSSATSTSPGPSTNNTPADGLKLEVQRNGTTIATDVDPDVVNLASGQTHASTSS